MNDALYQPSAVLAAAACEELEIRGKALHAALAIGLDDSNSTEDRNRALETVVKHTTSPSGILRDTGIAQIKAAGAAKAAGELGRMMSMSADMLRSQAAAIGGDG